MKPIETSCGSGASQAQSSVHAPASGVRRGWYFTAWLAGAFTLLVGLGMLWGNLTTKSIDPLKSPHLKAAKERLRLNPQDEPLKQEIRQLDLQLRRRYFSQLARTASGAYLLIGGAALFVLAVVRTRSVQRPIPLLQPKTDASEMAMHQGLVGRRSVAIGGAAIGALFFWLSLGVTTPLKPAAGGEHQPTSTSNGPDMPDAASPEDMARNWPRFRGPDGAGIAFWTNLPAGWDAQSGSGILWKVPVPTAGFNSPLVWGHHVFMSGGDAKQREIVCLDAKTGAVAWRQAIADVPGSPAQPPEVPDSTGYAAGSMATDGRRVYALFANGDLGAVTLDGKLVWSKSLGALKNPYGHATSLATWRDRVIVQLDQGEAEERRSKLYALDGRTGRVVWQKDRKVGCSWATPIVIEAAGKPQIITLAIPCVISYSTSDGAELWRADCMNGEITPSPVFAAGLVVVASPSDKLVAIRPDGQGDVTKTHLAWTNEDNVPDVTSPVANSELAFTVTTAGLLTCFDVKDGKKLWEHDFELECHASPTLVGNRLFILGQKGAAVMVEASRQYKELFRTNMEDAFHASAAFAQEGMILRGVTNVWCIGSK
jgi:outer membrane protein assembly factor BamB